ncbi:unnamed protein product [Blepharisma stoltei]|uniref:Uncharacterized protein n=1 Tax=Blepharisma stoltei TaxID=1481888 RepID=A0AAU9JDK1_9CILI|nr:unnamed protein product [Blepharisma stoltei]
MTDFDQRDMLIISSQCTDLKLRKDIINKVFSKIHEKLDFHGLPSVINRYWYHPKTEIDNYIIDELKKIVPLLGKNGVWIMAEVISRLSQVNINDHLELYNAISSLFKELALNNVGKLSFTDCDKLLDLAHKNMLTDLNFAQIICQNQMNNKLANNENKREQLIEKIKTVGLSDKNAVLAVCNKKNNFRTVYLAETISCLAELRFEKEVWANQMVKD